MAAWLQRSVVRLTSFLTAFFFTIEATYGQEFVERRNTLGFVKHTVIEVLGNAPEECWGSRSSVVSRVKLLFEQNGIKVSDQRFEYYHIGSPLVRLIANGRRLEDGFCFLSLELQVSYAAFADLRSTHASVLVRAFESGSLVSGYYDQSELVSEVFEGAASEFVARVLQARRHKSVQDTLELEPQLFEKPGIREE